MTTEVTNSGEHEDSTTAEVAADALDPLIGQTIDGRFRIVDVIGKGAMGKVYRAVQLPLNRAVALKVLDSRYGAGRDESFKQRFLVEAALTAKLNHPNTVRVLDYGTRDGLFFLAMEYLDGETLEKLLTRGPLPWFRVLSIGQQMARALREAHELGVVHRDLKPGNVVLLHADDDADFVKVLDFGLVKSFVEGHELEGRAITQQGMLMGSPPYMAPEQGEKNRADPRSDIYSLGTMLFEMLTGKPPFGGGGGLEVILKHVHEPVPPIIAPSKYESVPEALQAIVMRCLAKSPMDRFQSMDELLLALQDVTPQVRAPEPEPQAKTESAVPAYVPPEPEQITSEPVTILPPQRRGPSVLLIGGFFVAAVAGVLGTWSVVKPAAPTKLVFHVESAPSGANVIVDGKKLGVTPIDLEQVLGQGNRASLDLKLEKDGFAPSQVRLIGGGGKLDVLQTLSPLAEVKAEEPKKLDPAAAKLEEAKKLEEEKRLAEAKKADEAQKLAEAKKAEEAKQAEEAQKLADAKKAEETKKAAEAQALADAKRAEAEKKAEEKKLAEGKKAEEAQKLADAKKAAAEKKADEVKKLVEEKKLADAKKAEEAKKLADEKKLAEAKKAEEAKKLAEAKKAEDARKAEEAKKLAAEAKKAKQVAVAKPEPKKKISPTPAPTAPPPGPRPASKLDEDDESVPQRSEIKRPTAEP